MYAPVLHAVQPVAQPFRKSLGLTTWPSGHWSVYQAPRPSTKTPEGSVLPLGLSSPLISRNRAPRGSRGLSRRGRKLVASSAVLFECAYSRNRLSFVTLTLPFDDAERISIANRNWSILMKRFWEEVRRELIRHGLPPQFVFVNEFQKRGALHCHGVFVGRLPRQSWAIPTNKIDELWMRSLQSIFPDVDAECLHSACNVQAIKKSVAGYLAKYMSKGNELHEPYEHELTWYGISQKLRKQTLSLVVRDEVEIDLSRFDWFQVFRSMSGVRGVLSAKFYTLADGSVICLHGRCKLESIPSLRKSFAHLA